VFRYVLYNDYIAIEAFSCMHACARNETVFWLKFTSLERAHNLRVPLWMTLATWL